MPPATPADRCAHDEALSPHHRFLIDAMLCAVFFALVLALGYFGEEYPYGLAEKKIGVIKIEAPL